MKRIYLLRHAKSSWKDASLRDHERPLAGRGRRAAKLIARHMREEGVAPELVLCSTAKRARQTLERIEPALGTRSVKVEEGLYGAGKDELLARLRELPAAVGSVLVIGHNPGMQDLALLLARSAPELEAKFPTAALATLEFSGKWPGLEPGAAELVGFVRPRELERP
jgi:phosphohistidine phosphatase